MGHTVRVGWVVPVAITAFLVAFGIIFALKTEGSIDGLQERRTRVLGEVIYAEDPPPSAPVAPADLDD